MKKMLLCLFLFKTIALQSQIEGDFLRNYVWILGYGDEIQGPIYHTIFDFQGDSLQIKSKIVDSSLYMSYTNASICDTAGNLLFFSNGCGVMDSSFQFVYGASRINDGIYQNHLCDDVGGGRRTNSLLILPDWHGGIFHLIHFRSNSLIGIGLGTDKLYWSKIKRNEYGHLEALQIDSTIVDDLFFGANLSACRHGNGHDWWVVSPTSVSSRYYITKVTTDSILTHTQSIGISVDYFEETTGEAAFSPDGTRYARYTIHADLQIFDFDRCRGCFSNPIHISIVDAADTSYSAGLAFSPSGRYLYVSSTKYIYQFDLQAPDISASKITVALYDGFLANGYSTHFYQCELAPDGKIYVSCPGGKRAMHVIEHPDSAGVACQVVQHKHILEWAIYGGLPHFPNFRLGAIPDSICALPPPIAAWSWQASDTLLPLQVAFLDESGPVTSTWHWDFGDGTSSTEANPVHVYALSGTYTVCLVVGNAHGSDTLCQVVTVVWVGVQGVAGDRAVRVYPNPANTVLYVEAKDVGAMDFEVFNVWGIRVRNGRFLEKKGELDVSALPSGIFFLKIKDGRGVVRQYKFVVAR